jgi:hypothetical protein
LLSSSSFVDDDDDDELHNFLRVWILIGIDNAVAFMSFENYGIIANDFFFDLVQDFLFFFYSRNVL